MSNLPFLTFLLVFLSPLMAISTNSTLNMWLMLEVNTLSFIFMFSYLTKTPSHSFMVFFIIQAFSSMLLLISFSMTPAILSTNSFINGTFPLIFLFALFMKMGVFPFHLWLFSLSKMFSWVMNMTLMIWQKLIPLFILFKAQFLGWTLIMLLSMMITTLMQFFSNNLKAIIMMSSITHISWMIIPVYFLSVVGLVYLLIYSSIMIPLIMLFKSLKIWKTSKSKKISNFLMTCNIVNISGIPPLNGFILKWMALYFLVSLEISSAMMLIMLMISMVNLFVYFKIFIYMNNVKMKTHQSPSKMNTPLAHILIIFINPIIFAFS